MKPSESVSEWSEILNLRGSFFNAISRFLLPNTAVIAASRLFYLLRSNVESNKMVPFFSLKTCLLFSPANNRTLFPIHSSFHFRWIQSFAIKYRVANRVHSERKLIVWRLPLGPSAETDVKTVRMHIPPDNRVTGRQLSEGKQWGKTVA
jgi:hypothetical protein